MNDELENAWKWKIMNSFNALLWNYIGGTGEKQDSRPPDWDRSQGS
jgi:hypothetical protein